MNYEALPENLRGGMQRYIEDGIAPGDFLVACLSNNLMGAFGRAGPPGGWEIGAYVEAVVRFLYNDAPHQCHGSPDKVRLWIQRFKEEWQRDVSTNQL